jgi:rhodanese-related sulfurtransferase
MDNILRSMDIGWLTTGGWKIDADKFLELWKEGKAVLLDIRTREEVEFLPLTKFGINIPLHELPDRLNEIPKDKIVAVYCPGGHRSAMAYLYLRSKGFENVKYFSTKQEEFAGKLRPGLVKKLKK